MSAVLCQPLRVPQTSLARAAPATKRQRATSKHGPTLRPKPKWRAGRRCAHCARSSARLQTSWGVRFQADNRALDLLYGDRPLLSALETAATHAANSHRRRKTSGLLAPDGQAARAAADDFPAAFCFRSTHTHQLAHDTSTKLRYTTAATGESALAGELLNLNLSFCVSLVPSRDPRTARISFVEHRKFQTKPSWE